MTTRQALLTAAASLAAATTPRAGTVTWTGGGSGTNWNEAANWDGGVPGSGDTARFTDTGLSAGRVIVLAAAQTVDALELDTTVDFTIGHADGNTAGHTLTVTNVNRQGSSSGTQTIAADIVLAGDTAWTINGDGLLNAGKMSGGGILGKQGTGELRLGNARSTDRSGATVVNQGVFSVLGSGNNTAGAGQLGSGPLIVGNGLDAATFQLRWNGDWNFNLVGDNAAVIVKNNGVLDMATHYTAAGGRTDTVGSLTVEDGGLVKLGKWTLQMGSYIATNVLLRGGLITAAGGALSPVSGHVAVDGAATSMAVVEARLNVSYKYQNGALFTRLHADDVAALPVELKLAGELANVWDDRDGIDKVGPGVVKLTGSNTYGGRSTSEGRTRVLAGTLLVDNTSGSGTGKSHVPVSAGATLGGTGTIGGLVSSPNANVVLAGAPGNPAVLAPGTIDETTGAHIVGTLTVGGAAQTNNVTFGSHGKLRVTLDAAGGCDRLAVNGVLSLATPDDHLEIVVPADAKAGVYLLASATGGIAGTFDNVAMPASGMSLAYTATTIELTVPSPGTLLTLR